MAVRRATGNATRSSALAAAATELTFEQWDAVQLGVMRLADDLASIYDGLETRGFSAFRPWIRFDESFCDGTAEVAEYWRQAAAITRYRLFSFDHFPMLREQRIQRFQAFHPILHKQNQELLEREGAADWDDLDSKHLPYERTISDPYKRRKHLAQEADPGELEARTRTAREATAKAKVIESFREATDAAVRAGLSFSTPSDRVKALRLFLDLHAPGVGLAFDRRASRRHYLVLSRPAVPGFNLAVVVEDTRDLHSGPFLPYFPQEVWHKPGHLRFLFQVRSAAASGTPAAKQLVRIEPGAIPHLLTSYDQISDF